MWDPTQEKNNMLSHLGDFWYSAINAEDVALAHKLCHLPLQCRVIRQVDNACDRLTNGGHYHDNFLLIRFKDEDIIWYGKKDALQAQHKVGVLPDGRTGNSMDLDLTIPDTQFLQAADDPQTLLSVPWHGVAFPGGTGDFVFSQSTQLKFGLLVDPDVRVTSIRMHDGKMLYEHQDFSSVYGRVDFYQNPLTLFPKMEFMAYSYDYRIRNIYCYPLGVDVYGPVDRILYYTRIAQSPKSLYLASAQAAGLPVVREDCEILAVGPLHEGVIYYTDKGYYDADFPHTHLLVGKKLFAGEVIGGKELYRLIMPGEVVPNEVPYISLDFALPVKGLRAPNKTILVYSSPTQLRPAFEGDSASLQTYYTWLTPYDDTDYSFIPQNLNAITLVRSYLCAARVVIACVNVNAMRRDMYLRLVAFLRRELPLGSVLCIAPLPMQIDEAADIEEPKEPEVEDDTSVLKLGDDKTSQGANVYWWQWDGKIVPYGWLLKIRVRCHEKLPTEAYTGEFYLGIWQAISTEDGITFQRLGTSTNTAKLISGGWVEFTTPMLPLAGRTIRAFPVKSPSDGWDIPSMKLWMSVDKNVTPSREKNTMSYLWTRESQPWKVVGELTFRNARGVVDPTTPEEYQAVWIIQFVISGSIGAIDLSPLFYTATDLIRTCHTGIIDWGDGSAHSFFKHESAASLWQHTFSGSGPYTITIQGEMSAKAAKLAGTRFGAVLREIRIINGCPIREVLHKDGEAYPLLDFSGCTGLTGVTGDLYGNLKEKDKITDLDCRGKFKGCTGLEHIPEGLFDFPNLERLDATSMFEGCTGLSGIIDPLFPYPPKKQLITERMFAGDTGIHGEVPQFVTPENAPSELLDATSMFEGCTGLSGIVPDLFVVPPGGETVFSDMFRGCTGLKGLKAPNYGYYRDSDRKTWVDGMFYGCSGIDTEIPDMWNYFTDDDTEHHDCFKQDWNSTNWDDVPVDWGGEEQFQYAVRFFMQTLYAGQEINIAAWFCGKEKEHQGRIKWGDHTDVEDFSSADGEAKFRHVYPDAGRYRLEVTHTTSQDYIRMNGLISSSFVNSVGSIRAFLVVVDMKEIVRIKYIGYGIFDGCTRLSEVAWPKLFIPDFAWEGPAIFTPALRLRFEVEAGHELNLAAWFCGTTKEYAGRIKWGEYTAAITTFTPTSGESVFKHRYYNAGEYWVEVGPTNEDSILPMTGLTTSKFTDSVEDVRAHLTRVDVKGLVYLKYIGTATFDGCRRLSYVAWPKLFRPDYVWMEGEKMFDTAVKLRFKMEDLSHPLDLSAWFHGLGRGQLKWGDHREDAIEFDENSPVETFQHTYDREGEFVVEFAPRDGEQLLHMRGLLFNPFPGSVYSIRHSILEVTWRQDVWLQYHGVGIFDGCERLRKIDWPKLFRPEGVEYPTDELLPDALRLRFEVEVGDTVDLSAWLSGKEKDCKGRIKWGEYGTKVVDFAAGADASVFRHTYREKGDYWIEVAPVGDGVVRLNGLSASQLSASVSSVRRLLTGVDVKGDVKLRYIGDGTFHDCDALSFVAWEKLFRPDYADFPTEEMLPTAVKLRFRVPDEKTPLDLSAWFHGLGGGRIKWGDHGPEGVVDFTSSSPVETFRHQYSRPGEFVVEVAPDAAGDLRMRGLIRNSLKESAECIRKSVVSFTLRGEVVLHYTGIGIFDGCELLREVPWPKLFRPDVKDYPSEEVFTDALRLKFEGVKEVDLSTWFAGADAGCKGKVKWGEFGAAITSFTSTETVAATSSLKHTYAEVGDYWVEVAPFAPGEPLRMAGLKGKENATGVQKSLTAVDVKGDVRLLYNGAHTFFGCGKLRNVAWEKLFRQDFSWPGEEMFPNVLKLRIMSNEIDLSAWFQGLGYGRIKWGDHGEILEFTPDTPAEAFKHIYDRDGEHFLEIAPAKGKDRLMMRGLITSDAEASVASIRAGLRSVGVRGEVNIEYVGDGIFDSCDGLSEVEWPKLFHIDFAWEEDERFSTKLGLKLTFVTTYENQVIDLTSWFKGEDVKVLWGEGEGGATFGPEISEGAYRHSYETPGEYTVTVYPNPYGDREASVTLLGKPDASIATTLTAVDLDEGRKVKYAGNATFEGCGKMTSFAWEKLFTEVGEVDCTRMFAGCVGLTEVPDFTTGFTPTAMTEMFLGCSGLGGELPRWWEKWEALPHEDCFTGCRKAQNYPMAVLKGWADLEGESLIFRVVTPSEGYALDFASRLSVYSGALHTPAMAWGDGEVLELTEGVELTHTFAKAGEFEVLMVGEVKLTGLDGEEKDGLSEVLVKVEVPTGESGLCETEGRIFYLCEGLTEVDGNLFNGLKVETDLSYGFSRSGLKSIPETLLTSIPEEAGPLTLDYLFADCQGFTSIPAGLLPITTEIASMVGMFEGDMGVTEPVPTWWENEGLQALPHEDFFAGCKAAENWVDIPEDWGGEEKFAEATLVTITTTEENQVLNLAAWYKGDEEEHRGKVKWGDRTPMEMFDHTSPEEAFKHTYKKPGEYTLELAHATEQSYMRMNGLIDSAYPESVASIRAFLTGWDMKEVTPVKYVGDGIFDGCENLRHVAWEKLFTPDFSWEGPEVFRNALRLKFEGVSEVDLSSWLAGSTGRVSWGERGVGIASFAPEMPSAEGGDPLQHTYAEAGDYWVEVEPDEDGILMLNAMKGDVPSLAEGLVAVDVKGDVKLRYVNARTFLGCKSLRWVAWEKLFRQDFSWPGEEMLPNALKLVFEVTPGEEIDLSPWLHGIGEGKIKWGDHTDAFSFDPSTPPDTFKHTYEE